MVLATSQARSANRLFSASDDGNARAASALSRLDTAKLKGVELEARLRDVLTRIPDHLTDRIEQLRSCNLKAEASDGLPDGCGFPRWTT